MSRIDFILDWISDYRTRQEKHVAKVEAQRANTEWLCLYVAALATTLENADQVARRKVIAEINDAMCADGLWSPKTEEPSASAGTDRRDGRTS